MLENRKDVETFKTIKGYSNYQISTDGRIWSVLSQKYMKPSICTKGYYQVNLKADNGKVKRESVHRLVALTFIENPNKYPCVNHKDENKLNNAVNNLEWCSYLYNNQYSNIYESAARVNRRKVLCVETGKTYESITEASNDLGIKLASISHVVNHRHKTAGNYHFTFQN